MLLSTHAELRETSGTTGGLCIPEPQGSTTSQTSTDMTVRISLAHTVTRVSHLTVPTEQRRPNVQTSMFRVLLCVCRVLNK